METACALETQISEQTAYSEAWSPRRSGKNNIKMVERREAPTDLLAFQHDNTYDPSDLGFVATLKAKPRSVEAIKAWWSGVVKNINVEDRYIRVELVDLDGVRIETDIDFDVFCVGKELPESVFVGATLVSFVTRRITGGDVDYATKIEFTIPHVWKKTDTEHLAEVFSSLFPDDEPLNDEEIF